MKETINGYRKIADEKSSQPVSIKRKEFRELVNYINSLEGEKLLSSKALEEACDLAQSVKTEAMFRDLTHLAKRCNVFVGTAMRARGVL